MKVFLNIRILPHLKVLLDLLRPQVKASLTYEQVKINHKMSSSIAQYEFNRIIK